MRLFETIGGGGPLTLLTDGQEVYGRTSNGDLFNMLRDPQQPLLMLADVEGLRELGNCAPARAAEEETFRYSARSAVSGSTRVARSAGMALAASAAAASTTATPA